MSIKLVKKSSEMIVGILGYGEIGNAVARLCKEAGFKVLVRELSYDQLKGSKVDYLHINIPEKINDKFVKLVVTNIKELSPKLVIINSSITIGTTRKIYEQTKSLIVHSPVIGIHPHIYESIRFYFPKIIGPINKEALKLAIKHFKDLKLRVEVYDKPEDSEAAKLLDLVYYAWNIIFCKWINEVCNDLDLNFEQVYIKHNQIYNKGYKNLLPNIARPILKPIKGPIGGHCTIPDTLLLQNLYKNRFTKFILKEQKRYFSEIEDLKSQKILLQNTLK